MVAQHQELNGPCAEVEAPREMLVKEREQWVSKREALHIKIDNSSCTLSQLTFENAAKIE